MATFREWLETVHEFIDIDLSHWDVEGGYPIISTFNINRLTNEGLEFFADVLNATVHEIKELGVNWYAVSIRGCYESQVYDFCRHWAGSCTAVRRRELFKETGDV